MKELLKETFTYKVSDESDVTALIEEEKQASKGLVTYRHLIRRRKKKVKL